MKPHSDCIHPAEKYRFRCPYPVRPSRYTNHLIFSPLTGWRTPLMSQSERRHERPHGPAVADYQPSCGGRNADHTDTGRRIWRVSAHIASGFSSERFRLISIWNSVTGNVVCCPAPSEGADGADLCPSVRCGGAFSGYRQPTGQLSVERQRVSLPYLAQHQRQDASTAQAACATYSRHHRTPSGNALLAEGHRCTGLAPYRLVCSDGCWYLTGEHEGHEHVFTG